MRAHVALSFCLALSACKCSEEAAPDAATSADAGSSLAAASSRGFGELRVAEVKPRPAVVSASIAPDLSNVEIASLLTASQRAKIAANGFAVSPGKTKEFYELYERARYEYVPIFVTSDSLLHVYHLLFAKTLRRVEAARLSPRLLDLDTALLDTALANLTALEGGEWVEAAKRTAAYFAVAKKLLAPDAMVSPAIAELVEPELARIKAKSGIEASSIFPAYPQGEDWTQYAPRGHYTKTEELSRYFLAMTWHGRMTFRTSDLEETKSAALLMYALDKTSIAGRPAREIWTEIYEPTVFFVGQSDDLTPVEYLSAYRAAFGEVKSAVELATESKLTKFQAELAKLRAPQILGMVVTRGDPDGERNTRGLRFMGQRFVPDAFVFRQLVHPNVPERYLPKALDFFAVLGSDRARELAEDSREHREKVEELREVFNDYGRDVYAQSLYWAWIYSLTPLLEVPGEGYPRFMQSEAWVDKQLTTALGSWTELKHDTILYSKPVYAEMGGGGLPPPEPVPPKGYVEPVPEVFARIVGLAEMTRVGLARRGLLDTKDGQALEKLEALGTKLGAIALKELTGGEVTPAEYELIRFYGGKIEELTFASTDEIELDSGGMPEGGGDALQAAIVADIATDPNGRVLEEAIGRVFNLYAVVPIEGKLVLAEGGVFSHYEFEVPLAGRLTDEAWRKRLDEGRAPPLAEWTKSFMATEVVSQELAERIRQFSETMIQSLWYTSPSEFETYLIDDALASFTAQVADLKKKRGFIGRERLGIEFLSFDYRGADEAVVTTRERWKDDLNLGDPVEEDLTKVTDRGPYETVVTYTLEKKRGAQWWMISKIVHRPPIPQWK